MMKALVVYESMFGNTEEVARAVADGISEHMRVELREVGHAPADVTDLVDLLVVGGPTHAFSLSRPSTRAQAIEQGAQHGEEKLGLREWLEGLHDGPHPELVATFDTRVTKVRRLPGSAAKKAKKLAKDHGYASAGSQSFFVDDVPGPLLPGELERARAWGAELASGPLARLGGTIGPRGADGRRAG